VVIPTAAKGRDLLRLRDWPSPDLDAMLDVAERLKARQRERVPHRLLEGRSLAMIFEKPSTRTRVSFGVGMTQLGGTALELPASDLQLGHGEPIRDTAYVLSRYCDAIVFRTFRQATVELLAQHADVPVINGLTDEAHPCQAIADALTIKERFGGLSGVRVAYLGDGNNTCHSLVEACTMLGAHVVVASPEGYEPAADVQEAASAIAATTGGSFGVVHDPREAAAGADVLYTDVWTSMGQEAERDARHAAFALYGIDEEILGLASERAIVMHCLPARVGEEITERVLYGERSAVWDQAENRLHAQKALLAFVVR
jgi:ornithine carbamoyltransferase